MRFPRIRLVEQTEQKFVASSLSYKKEEKTSDCNSRALLLIKAQTNKNKQNLSFD